MARLPFRALIFARQWAAVLNHVEGLSAADRAGPIAGAVRRHTDRLSGVFVEYPETNEGKALSGFARKFRRPVATALARAGLVLDTPSAPRLHLFFTDSADVRIALAPAGNSAPWPQGILRLRMPGRAPSRSTLKLDEALHVLLTAEEAGRLLRPGGRAVDLGAAPGGWTWQLVQRGLQVSAVDNGPMDAGLMDTGQVEHRRSDAFTYRPTRPVDLVVCDIVDKPKRVAALMAQWLNRGDCRAALFNLKLPMRQRYAAVRDCLTLIGERVERRTGRPPVIACKHLYHDREEVTALVRLG